MLQYNLINDTVRWRLITQSTALYYQLVNKDFNNLRSWHVATDHLSVPHVFFVMENSLNCNSQGFQQAHFTLLWKSKSITLTFEKQYNFQLKCGNLHYLNLIKRAHLIMSWTKAKGIRSIFAWLQAFKRCRQYKHTTKYAISKD